MTQIDNIKPSELAYYQELLSALSDGELSDKELSDLLHVLGQKNDFSAELMQFWSRIGLSKRLLKGNVHVLVQKKTNHFSGLQNFSIAASVMFAVVFAWLFAQAPVREVVTLALFPQDVKHSQPVTERVQQLAVQDSQSLPTFNYSRQVIPVSVGNLGQAHSGTHAQHHIHLSDARMAGYMQLHSQAQPWQASWLPQGFVLIGMSKRAANSDDVQVERLMYSDGLSTMSVFIEPVSKVASFGESSQRDGMSAYSQGFKHAGQGYMITAMGEVPLHTLERVVKGVSYQTK